MLITTVILAVSFLARLPQESPPDPFAEASRGVEAAVAEGLIPGAVLLIGRGESVLHQVAIGERAPGIPMTLDTVFDVASVTKSVVTGASIARLMEAGRLAASDRVDELLPDLVPQASARRESP
jgi:CubicO group peptidase (beta-lactamase class C family)